MTKVTCRGIPLLGLPVTGGSGGSGEGTYYVSVHQLAVKLWQHFDTPRPSVQKKLEDLGIPLTRCNKNQLHFFRKNGVVEGFRATIISILDAERVCDALQHSREKRGLVKHPLKTKVKEDGGRRKSRREEGWLLKMNARMSSASLELSDLRQVVDKCALIGDTSTPTPSPIVEVQIRGSPTSKGEQLFAGEEIARQSSEYEFSQSSDYGLLKEFSHLSRSLPRHLEALNLFAENSWNMATLRSHQTANRNSTNTGSLHNGKQISRLTRVIKIHRPRPVSLPTSPMKRLRLHPDSAVPVKEADHKQDLIMSPKIMSPKLLSGSDQEEELVATGEAIREEMRGKASARRSSRLFLDSDDDGDVLEEVSAKKQSSDVAVGNGKVMVSGLSQPLHPKRVIKLRHFAHTTSPTAAASVSPGKQLPLGSASLARRSMRQYRKPLLVSISRSLIHDAQTQPLTHTRRPSTRLRDPSSSRTPELEHLLKNREGRPTLTNKCRPKQTLSSFATMKRARVSSPVGSNPKPSKQLKPGSSVNSDNAGSLDSGVDTSRKSEKKGPCAEPVSSQTVPASAAAAGKGCTARAVGGAGPVKPLPLSNGTGAQGVRTREEYPAAVPPANVTSSHHHRGGMGAKNKGGKAVLESETLLPGTIKFEQLFGYYPPKLVVQDGDLCPEHSLSVSGLERSKLSSLSPSHPFWSWTLGQPTNKVSAPSIKTSKRKLKTKTAKNNVP